MPNAAENYAEWCGLSGLYLANLSHVDRYRVYGKALSPAGLTVAIVSDFLDDANPALDVDDWRTYRVYEFGPGKTERVERTVAALREIGASALAEAVGSSRSNSPFEALQSMWEGGAPDIDALAKSVNAFDMVASLRKSLGQVLPGRRGNPKPDDSESPSDARAQRTEDRKRVRELLEQFAQRHREALQADVDRHGDPRLEAGYTVERRMRELDAMRARWVSHQTQADAIETLTKIMEKLPKITQQKTEGKEKKAAQHLKQLLRLFREKSQELRRVAEADRSSQFLAFWPKLQGFEAQYADLVSPDVIGDAELRRAAEEIGDFSAESKRKATTLEWSSPRGLKCDWTTFDLTVDVIAKSKSAIRAGLQAVERLRAEFPRLQEEWRQQTLDSFRENYQGQMDESELEDYDLDDDGEPSDAGILRHVESGSLMLSTADPEGRGFTLTAYLSVEWDQEHGQELECEIDFDAGSQEAGAEFEPGDVTMTDSGTPLRAEDILRFESTFKIALPADYREFLLRYNGGVPSKNYLIRTRDGMEDNWRVARFLTLTGTLRAPFPPDSLEACLHLSNGTRISSHLLPIALLRKGTFDPINRSTTLAIILSGKRAGKIGLFDAEVMLEPLLETGDALEVALDEIVRNPVIAGANFPDLWKKLQSAPEFAIPEWLRCIRQDDVPAFLAWAAGGGDFAERLIEPGGEFQPTVVDLLAAEASGELLEAVVKQKVVRPKSLRDAWRHFLFMDVPRFRKLMPLLPKDQWYFVLGSPKVWDHPDLLDELAVTGVNLETAIDEEGGTALHRAVQLGRTDAVRWLLDHGADPKKADRYGRTALIYAESGQGNACLAMLEGRPEPTPTGTATPDAPGIAVLSAAAAALPAGITLRLQIEMTSPPVTRVEKVYYAEVGCHYRLTFEVNNGQVTFNDTRSPRQDYLHAKHWVDGLFAPILQWPKLTPLWETLSVQEFALGKALKSRKYVPAPRDDLISAARSALEQAFDSGEASARGIRVSK